MPIGFVLTQTKCACQHFRSQHKYFFFGYLEITHSSSLPKPIDDSIDYSIYQRKTTYYCHQFQFQATRDLRDTNVYFFVHISARVRVKSCWWTMIFGLLTWCMDRALEHGGHFFCHLLFLLPSSDWGPSAAAASAAKEKFFNASSRVPASTFGPNVVCLSCVILTEQKREEKKEKFLRAFFCYHHRMKKREKEGRKKGASGRKVTYRLCTHIRTCMTLPHLTLLQGF